LTINQEDLTSEELVRSTRLDFMKLFGVTAFLQVNATVLGKYSYVEEGTTHIVLHLNNDTYPWVETTPNDVTTSQWDELLATEAAQKVTVQIEKRGDRWMATYFDNVNIP
jgi:hypothetical protein